jgi:hypothetical protein
MPIIIDENGLPREVDESEQRAFGYATPSPEALKEAQARQAEAEAKNAFNPLEMGQTFVEGVGRELTMGFADPLVQQVAPEYYERVQERAERNPISAGAGRVVGFAAPIIASAGTGGLVKGAVSGARAASGASRLARIGEGLASVARYSPAGLTNIAGEAVEAGVARALGSGASLTGAALKTGAKWAARGAVEGAIYGAGEQLREAAITNDYEDLAEKVILRSGESALMLGAGSGLLGAFGGMGAKAVGGAANYGKKQLKALAETGWAKKTLQELRETQTFKAMGATPGQYFKANDEGVAKLMVETIHEKKLLRGNVQDADEKVLERVLGAKAETGQEIGRVRNALDEAAKVDKTLLPDFEPLMDFYNKQWARIRGETGEILTQKDVREFRLFEKEVKGFFDKLTEAPVKDADGRFIKGGGISWKETADFKAKVYNAVKSDPGMGGIRVDGKDTEMLESFRQLFNKIETDGLEKAAGKVPDLVSPKEFTKTLKHYKALSNIEDLLAKRVIEKRMHTPFQLMSGVTTLAAGVAGGLDPVSTVATGMAIQYGRDRFGVTVAKLSDAALKGQSLISGEVKSYLRKAGKIAEKAGTVAKAGGYALTGRGANELETKKNVRVKAASERLKQAKIELAAAKTDANNQLEHPNPDYPESAKAVAKKRLAAVDYLEQRLPKPRKNTIDPFSKSAAVSEKDMQKWERMKDVADKPQNFFKAMKAGKIAPEHVETLAYVYPKIYNDVKTELAKELKSGKHQVSPSQKTAIRTIFRANTPQSLKIKQSVFNNEQEQPQGGRSPDQASKYQTDMQRIGAA